MIVEKLSPHTGAEARGVDLREPFDAAALNRAFVEHSVLVIRSQRLTPHSAATVRTRSQSRSRWKRGSGSRFFVRIG